MKYSSEKKEIIRRKSGRNFQEFSRKTTITRELTVSMPSLIGCIIWAIKAAGKFLVKVVTESVDSGRYLKKVSTGVYQ